MTPRIAATVTLAFLSAAAFALKPDANALRVHQTLTARCVRVTDGDTFWLEVPGKAAHKIRLHGADAPETKSNRWPEQPGCYAAQDWLTKAIEGKEVTITVKGKSYDRWVCKVEFKGRDLSIEMIELGLCHADARYATAAQKLAEVDAKAKKLGVWKDGKAVTPADWRKGIR